jgi:hypothetical protein
VSRDEGAAATEGMEQFRGVCATHVCVRAFVWSVR